MWPEKLVTPGHTWSQLVTAGHRNRDLALFEHPKNARRSCAIRSQLTDIMNWAELHGWLKIISHTWSQLVTAGHRSLCVLIAGTESTITARPLLSRPDVDYMGQYTHILEKNMYLGGNTWSQLATEASSFLQLAPRALAVIGLRTLAWSNVVFFS